MRGLALWASLPPLCTNPSACVLLATASSQQARDPAPRAHRTPGGRPSVSGVDSGARAAQSRVRHTHAGSPVRAPQQLDHSHQAQGQNPDLAVCHYADYPPSLSFRLISHL